VLDLFPDHQPLLKKEEDCGWTFFLTWSLDYQFVDSDVCGVARRQYGLDPHEIGGYREILQWGDRDVVISMVHSWALLAPSISARRHTSPPARWVVHFDDHKDLMALIFEKSDNFRTRREELGRIAIALASPESISAAITGGLVNKGNFLAAYALAFPDFRIVHVGAGVTERRSWLSPRTSSIELSGKNLTRSELLATTPPTRDQWNFFQTRSLPKQLPIKPDERVWLDLDLDFFCNPFDGDSDRRSIALSSRAESYVLKRIKSFARGAAGATWLPNVDAVSLALSPGFFPASFWKSAIPLLVSEVEKVLSHTPRIRQ